MSSTRKAIAVLLVTMAVLTGSWLVHRAIGRNGGAVEAPATPDISVAHRVPGTQPATNAKIITELVPKKVPSKGKQPSHFVVRAPRDKPDLVVAEVKAAAEAGDLEAMRTLGEVLNECARADMRSDSEIEAAAAKESLDIEYLSRHGVTSARVGGTDPARWAVDIADRKKRLRDSCLRIPVDELKTAGDWIARAAASGDENASLDLAGTLVPRINDQSLLLEQREQLRSQLLDLLQNQIALGHCNDMVLNLYWRESHDPMLVYIYGGILMRRGIAAIDSQPADQREAELALIQKEDREFAAALPQDQLGAAQATREYIEANYCSNLQN